MLLNTVLLALKGLKRNPMRSFLTMLGIVIGVSAVVTMVTLGNGTTASVSQQIASLGSNLIMISPGQRGGPGSAGSVAPGLSRVSMPPARRWNACGVYGTGQVLDVCQRFAPMTKSRTGGSAPRPRSMPRACRSHQSSTRAS